MIRFIQACMELIDRQTYISWSLPEDWHIILSANPDDGSYLVTSMDDAQKSRFISVDLKFDEKIWAVWAENNDIDGRGINFTLLHPELVNSRVNARSITTFFNAISSIEDFEKQLPLIQMIGEGSTGTEFTTMFTTFIHGKLDKLITPETILNHKNEAWMIGELKACVGADKTYRADIASVIITRLINYTLRYSETNAITQTHIDRLIRLSTDTDIFNNDLQYILIKKIFNGNKQKFQKLLANLQVMDMALK